MFSGSAYSKFLFTRISAERLCLKQYCSDVISSIRSKQTCVTVLLICAGALAQNAQALDESTRHIMHELGGPFIIYRSGVQSELKLSSDQKSELSSHEHDCLQQNLNPNTARSSLWSILQRLLKSEQLTRFKQLDLQHEGPPALLSRPDLVQDLQLTRAQLEKIKVVAMDLSRQIRSIVSEAHSGADSQSCRMRGVKAYAEAETKIEQILTDRQRQLWKVLIGPSFDVFDDN